MKDRHLPFIPAAALSRRSLLKGAAALAAAPLLTLARPAAADAAQDEKDIKRIEDYLNNLKTMKARFQQVSQQGGVSRGWLYLRRPGQMRVQYDPPTPVLLVSDGTMVSYYDAELDQLNQVPLSSSPLWFLLRPNVRLNRDVKVNLIERRPGALRITIVQADEPEAGTVSLVFRDPPLELLHWYIKDEQGQEIQVALYDTEFGVTLENALFATPQKQRTSGRSGSNR